MEARSSQFKAEAQAITQNHNLSSNVVSNNYEIRRPSHNHTYQQSVSANITPARVSRTINPKVTQLLTPCTDSLIEPHRSSVTVRKSVVGAHPGDSTTTVRRSIAKPHGSTNIHGTTLIHHDDKVIRKSATPVSNRGSVHRRSMTPNITMAAPKESIFKFY